MILFLLALLAFSKASLGDVICEGEPFETCPRPTLFTTLPVSKTEYDELCPDLRDYIACLGRLETNCTTKFFTSPEDYTNVLRAFSEFCEDGSLLNIIFTENLKCLNESLGSDICRVQADAAASTFEDLTSVVTDTEVEIPYIGSPCLYESFLTACIADEISKNCGSLVKDASLEMVQRSYLIQEACSVEEVTNILENGDLVLLTPSYQQILDDVLERME